MRNNLTTLDFVIPNMQEMMAFIHALFFLINRRKNKDDK